MELPEIIEKAKQDNNLSQNKLATRIGSDKSNISQVLHGKRRLTAEAAIELSAITGIQAKEIWEAAKRWSSTAACVMLAVVTLFLSAPQNAVAKTETYSAAFAGNTHYGALVRRLRAKAKRLAAWLRRSLVDDSRHAGFVGCADT